MARKQNTTKKVKVVGHVEYVNQATGEVEDFQVVRMEDRDFDFHKIWLGHVINSLDLIGNQKTQALIDSNFIQRVNMGVYRVNPETVFKGSRGGRLNVLYQYENTSIENEKSQKSKNKENQ